MKSLSSLFVIFAVAANFVVPSSQESVLPDNDIKGGNFDVELKMFSNCEEYPSMPMMFRDVLVNQIARKKFAVSGGLDMNVTVTDDVMASITVTECKDSTSDDTCEYVTTLRGSNFCEKITHEGTPWYKFVEGTDIGNKCPVNPGSYEFEKAPLDFEEVDGIPLTPGYWKLRMELFPSSLEGESADGEQQPIGCNKAEISVTASRGGLKKP